jgi:hypothetical protein
MLLSVVLLMWLRTTLQYQYTTGVTTVEAFQHLYSEGGVRRFYSGVGYAMIQAPLARFGDTAANEGVKELFEGTKVPPTIVTLVAALVAGIWRVCISPVDMFKTTMQVCMWTGRATAVPPSAHSSASFDHAYPHCSLYMHARTHARTHTHTHTTSGRSPSRRLHSTSPAFRGRLSMVRLLPATDRCAVRRGSMS